LLWRQFEGYAPHRLKSRGIRGSAALVVACTALCAAGARAEISPELAQAIATTKAKLPKLVHWGEGDHYLAGVDDAELAAFEKRIRAGQWDEGMEAATWVILDGFSREQGPAATFGRSLAGDIAGAAATSESLPALEGVGRVLDRFLEDQSHPLSIMSQALLAEKIRCGAASLGADALVRKITADVNPDKEHDFGATDGTVADRYGLHQRADLFALGARGSRVAAVGYFGSVLISNDSGATWDAPVTGTDEPLYAVALGPGDELWAAGRAGVVLRSGDGGRSWIRRPTPFARHVFGLYAPAAGTVLAVGDFGLQLASDNAGERWRCIPRSQDVILGHVVQAGADASVVGEFGTIERVHGMVLPGVRGKLEGVPDDAYIFDAWFDAEGKTGVAVGLAGTILRTADAGVTWAPLKSGLAEDLYGVGGSGSHVVVSGEGGLLALSTDGGLTFKRADAPALPVGLHDVEFGDESHAYAVGPWGMILRSEDAGAHWKLVHGGGG
jgi:photosystem II stability/assembly factor-like uncharacterized protein